jgi:hypothetical protein
LPVVTFYGLRKINRNNGTEMKTYIGIVKKAAAIEMATFRKEWSGYRELAAKLPGVVAYHWNEIVKRVDDNGDLSIAGFSEFYFEDNATPASAIRTSQGQALLALENRFLESHLIVETEQYLVIPPPDQGAKIKRMGLVRRKEELSIPSFIHEWRDVHAPMIKAMSRILGYRQNLILNRFVNWTWPVRYDVLPYDGIPELWFESLEDMQAEFASPSGKIASAHAAKTSSESIPFLIEI